MCSATRATRHFIAHFATHFFKAMQSISKLILLLGALIGIGSPLPDKVPIEACDSMTPGHGSPPQDNSNSPYQIRFLNAQVDRKGVVRVQLSKINSTAPDYKGFYVQARNPSGTPVGTFVMFDSETKTHSCSGGENNAIFHGFKKDPHRSSTHFYWKAPNQAGTVELLGTFVQNFNVYWVQLKGGNIIVL